MLSSFRCSFCRANPSSSFLTLSKFPKNQLRMYFCGMKPFLSTLSSVLNIGVLPWPLIDVTGLFCSAPPPPPSLIFFDQPPCAHPLHPCSGMITGYLHFTPSNVQQQTKIDLIQGFWMPDFFHAQSFPLWAVKIFGYAATITHRLNVVKNVQINDQCRTKMESTDRHWSQDRWCLIGLKAIHQPSFSSHSHHIAQIPAKTDGSIQKSIISIDVGRWSKLSSCYCEGRPTSDAHGKSSHS